MKTITLTVDFVCEVEDDSSGDSLCISIPVKDADIKIVDIVNACKVVGRVKCHETVGFFEEEKIGLGEFEDKPEKD